MAASDPAIALTTAASRAQAETLARALVEARLAACVNVVPGVTSIYRWRGEICTDAEHLLVIKTRASLFARLREELRRLHSYELPELLLVPVPVGDPGYLAWLAEETS